MDEMQPRPALADAHLYLKQFDCLKHSGSLAPAERLRLRQALLQVADQSDHQLLGICADTLAQAQQALQTYAQALGYQVNCALEPIDGPVYLKFNPKAGSCYANPYVGQYRGVLVSCQSAAESDINEIYGHLPLDLFM